MTRRRRASVPPAPTGTAAPVVLSPAQRGYFYGTATVAGAAVMIIEILGAKMLAPFFGTSHFVWTAQIAVTLVALAAGYYAGGRWADSGPRPARLFAAILGAALAVVLATAAVAPVSGWALSLSLAAGSFMASLLLFFVPLFLLAMCGPFLIRVLADDLGSVGGHAGRIGAVSTVGSFVGTLLVGYLLIPRLGNARIMHLTATALALCAAGYFVVWGRRRPRAGAIGTAVLAFVIGQQAVSADARPPAFEHTRELFRGNSNFGQVQVLESKDGASRLYLNDYLVQNGYDPRTKQSTSVFTYALRALARGYTEKLERVLCIGLGVGIVPRELARDGARVEVVEINPAVVPVARDYFHFDPAKVQVTIDDGRHYVRVAAARTYDAVILDAFLGDSSPTHLMTREAFAEIARVLKPGGVLVINSYGNAVGDEAMFSGSLARTLAAAFPAVKVHDVGLGNVFFVASPSPLRPFVARLDAREVHPQAEIWVFRTLEHGRVPEYPGGMLLTDDFNPMDYHDARHRESIRRALLQRARLY